MRQNIFVVLYKIENCKGLLSKCITVVNAILEFIKNIQRKYIWKILEKNH